MVLRPLEQRLLLVFGLAFGIAGCSSTDPEDSGETNDELAADDKEYSFKHAFPANDLFKDPLTKSFDVEVEKHGLKLQAKITPTARIAIGSPVVEGKVTVGRRRLLSAITGHDVPKILDAELKATSAYKADMTVDFDLRWITTEPKEISREAVMREIAQELESKLNGGKGMTLATEVGKKMLGLQNESGETRSDMPLGAYYDIVVTCGLEELSGDLVGTLKTGIDGSVTARAVYNVEGVEKRRFRKDPTRKFELDKSNFKFGAPSFDFASAGQTIKGSCSVQPVVVVSFAPGTGVRLRVDGRARFETAASFSADGRGWRLHAEPELNVWGEADLKLPIINKTLDKTALLFTQKFPAVDVAAGNVDR